MKRRLHSLFLSVVIVTIAVAVASSCYLCAAIFGLGSVPEILLRPSLNLYPNAQHITDEMVGFGTTYNLKVAYYWTSASEPEVAQYYALNHAHDFIFRPASIWSTLYGHQSANNEGGCEYTEYYSCFRVHLIEVKKQALPNLSESETAYLKKVINQWKVSHPEVSRTLITYTYYAFHG